MGESGEDHEVEWIFFAFGYFAVVVAEEECGFAEGDGGAKFDHYAFIWWYSVEDCEGCVGIGDVADVGLADAICPSWGQCGALVVALEGFPDL